MPIAFLSYSDSNKSHKILLDRETISIGRSGDHDIALGDAYVSRQHALIKRDGDRWTVLDQNSTHGTYLNSKRATEEVLRSGDILQIGSPKAKKLMFVIQESDQAGLPNAADSLNNLLSSISGRQGLAKDQPSVARELGQLRWLLDAARQLNEGVGINDILGILLKLTLQLTGVERGFVFLATDGKLRFARGLDSAGEALVEDETISRKSIETAIRSRKKFSASDTSSDAVAAGWSSIVVNEIRSVHCIPLRKRVSPGELSQLIGLLYLDSRIESGSLTDIDHRLLDTVANEAAALLQSALLAETEKKARKEREELAVAARIHKGLMAIALPLLPYAELRAKSVPCLAIGGDFYDAVVLDDCVCITIVDVSGKGVSAAIVAATLQGIIHAQLLARLDLATIAAMLNRFLYARDIGKYATMVIVKLFPNGQLEYINCAHLLPLVITGKHVRRLEATNLMVGLISDASYTSSRDALHPGERILLATDGVTEAENSEGKSFEEQWLSAAVHCRSIGEILNQVAKFHAPDPAQDDCTLVEMRYVGVE